MSERKRGTFLVIEGTDGSGKGTQVKLLSERIAKETGREVTMADFPQYENTFFGKLVGRYLNGEFGDNSSVSPYLATVLYAADRWQAKMFIENALAEGKIVLSNRYVLSNIGHQVPKVPPEEQQALQDFIYEMEYKIFCIPQEDLNIFLYVPPEVAQVLVDKKAAREHLHGKKRDIHEADIDHLKKAVQMYERIAEQYPERVIMVDCTDGDNLLPIEEVGEKVWEVARRHIAK